ncbi:MAG: 4Fe-4S dicluster domain-containing protein [Deltaproteobacteria bacterium]|nr:4Fe-4S dicluster domain-containing protein [Deltaproteobacteria bacterium]
MTTKQDKTAQRPTWERPQWVDLEHYAALEAAAASKSDVVLTSGADDGVPEGQDGQAELTLDGVSRRTFLGVMGAGAAMAGIGLSGCIRKPVTPLVPHKDQPEDFIPGKPVYYATAYQAGATVQGVLVESHDGRPTKIEGNPLHPESLGATSATVQASVLGLYDLDRSVEPKDKSGAAVTWDEAWRAFDAFMAKPEPLLVLTSASLSPTERRMLTELAKRPGRTTRLFVWDPLWPYTQMSAASAIGATHVAARLENADVVAVFDADILGVEHSSVRLTKGFSKKRRVEKPGDPMSRLYAVEPSFSVTGAMADHRIRATPANVGLVLGNLAHALAGKGVAVPAEVLAKTPKASLPESDKFVAALAADLTKPENKGRAAVLVGYRQPTWVQVLALAVNQALDAFGADPATAPMSVHKDASLPPFEDVARLPEAIQTTKHVLVLGANPAQAKGLLSPDHEIVHVGLYHDETGKLATLHLPSSHFLESWGDLQALSGAVSLVQPLVAPLHHTPSQLEVLARAATGTAQNGYALVRDTWKSHPEFSEKAWRRWLHDGVITNVAPVPAPASLDWAGAAAKMTPAAAGSGVEVAVHLDHHRLDGRYANNAWLQEAPDPMTKLAWDNAALVSKKHAAELGVENGDMVTVTLGGDTVELPVKIHPGQAQGVVSVVIGHGRKEGGRVAALHGHDAWPLLKLGADGFVWSGAGAIARGSGSMKLCDIQTYGNSITPRTGDDSFGPKASPKTAYEKGKGGFVPRPIVFESTKAEYEAPENANWIDATLDRTFDDKHVGSLMYPERRDEKHLPGGARKDADYLNGVHQWGMSIDLNVCTGCNACMLACQAENNIPVVGRDRVIVGREMQWIRLDRYFMGDADDPQAVLQPMTCQQCETAPCEAVCPVKATAHSSEGLNDMAYNRCIGTRYCLNNCPYKVRRFNFFNYNTDIHPLRAMQYNPDVTIRFRGVMEKCTYCVQRINQGKIEAKIHGNGKVPDGAVVTACQQVCPADAIVFGNIDDDKSLVAKRKNEKRTYQVLRDLNTRPRTTYMAKIRNTNPDLV